MRKKERKKERRKKSSSTHSNLSSFRRRLFVSCFSVKIGRLKSCKRHQKSSKKRRKDVRAHAKDNGAVATSHVPRPAASSGRSGRRPRFLLPRASRSKDARPHVASLATFRAGLWMDRYLQIEGKRFRRIRRGAPRGNEEALG